MTKEEQTSEVKIRLHNLVQSFVRSYWQKYYYQYRGDLYDLAMEFYCDFLTPKARKGKPKETLLDKFNPEITSLEYLVKVSVIRKLIDRSRADSVSFVSIDALIEEYGDMISQAFDLVATDVPEEVVIDSKFQKRLEDAYSKLDELAKNTVFSKLYESDSPLSKLLKPQLHFINGCPIQQITDKTVVLFVPQYKKCVNFSLLDGHPKGNYHPFILSELHYKQYHSGFSRETFEDYLTANFVSV